MEEQTRVLLLVQDPDLLSVIRDFLSAEGFSVVEPDERGPLATGSFDLVVAEPQALEEHAPELARTDPQPPVVILAGMEEMARAATRRCDPPDSRASRVLPKPVSMRTLERALIEMGGAGKGVGTRATTRLLPG